MAVLLRAGDAPEGDDPEDEREHQPPRRDPNVGAAPVCVRLLCSTLPPVKQQHKGRERKYVVNGWVDVWDVDGGWRAVVCVFKIT